MSTIENPAPAAETYPPARSPARAHLADVIALLAEARRIDSAPLTSTPLSHMAVHTMAAAARDAALAVLADEAETLMAEAFTAADVLRGVAGRMNGLRAFADARAPAVEICRRMVDRLDEAFASMRVERRLADGSPEAAMWCDHFAALQADADAVPGVPDEAAAQTDPDAPSIVSDEAA